MERQRARFQDGTEIRNGLRSGVLRSALLLALVTAGCANHDDLSLSKQREVSSEIPKVPVPPENGPKLASIADLTPVYERPTTSARRIGYLHAGDRVSRAAEPYTREGCADGWFPVRPAGFVCASGGATTDLRHPTLAAMAIQPLLDQPLPYTYARTITETPLYERDGAHENTVREIGKLKRRTGMAVVGSWTAAVLGNAPERLALLTNGKFVKAGDLEAAIPSSFHGVELGEKQTLPLAFVVKHGVRDFKLDGEDAEQGRDLDVHTTLDLTGKFRTAHGEKFWAISNGRWVRHKDVTTLLARNNFPDFAVEGQKWLDVSVVMGTLVAYEGKRPFFATLVSVGRDAAPASAQDTVNVDVPSPTAAFGLGTFEIRAKHITLVGADPFSLRENYQLYDVPWVFELSSGRLGYGAYWHDRFGVEHGSGGIELSPADAARLFQWLTPSVPDGWHGVSTPHGEAKTLVVLRK
jgi:hypothetical protein